MIRFTKDTGVLVQGITGHQGSRHAAEMLSFGTKVVAGVTPDKGGESIEGLPVYDTVREAMDKTGASCSAIFVPARRCMEAAIEALEGGIELLVIVTEHVPIHDSMRIKRMAELKGATVIGPNSPGLAIPSVIKIGIMPNSIFSRGRVAVISRSGTLTYEVVQSLTDNGIGQSFVAGIGGDPVVGSSMKTLWEGFTAMDMPDAVVLIGEIGGKEELWAAESILRTYHGPVVSYIAGRTAPPGKRMGHAGAIIGDSSDTYADKVASLRSAGVIICERMSDVPLTVRNALI